MALKAKITKALYDNLSAETKALYKGTGDAFILDVEPSEGWNLEDVSGLRSALQSEQNNAKNLSATLKAFDGIDAVKAKADLAAYQSLLNDPSQKAVTEAKIKSITEQLEQKHAEALKPYVEKNAFLEKQVHKALKESNAISAISAAKGSTKLLLPHVLAAMQVIQEGDNLVPRILDENGEIRITRKQGVTTPMEVTEFVELLKNQDDFKYAFQGTQMAGGGAQGGNNGAGGSGKFLVTEDIARNPQAYQKLSEAAKAAGQPLEFMSR